MNGANVVSQQPPAGRQVIWHSLAAMFRRDVVVGLRQAIPFLMMMLLQPLFFLYVFGRILPATGLATNLYPSVLSPGIIALSMYLAGLQGMAFEVGSQFGWTYEIEDRLLAPVPTWAIALEQVLFGALRAMLVGVLTCVLNRGMLGIWPGEGRWEWGTLMAVGCLVALSSAAMGLTVGTLVKPNNVGMVFSLVLTPLLFLGGPFYPWVLLKAFPGLRVVALINPLLYASEGMRAAMVPGGPHMTVGVAIAGLMSTSLLFLGLGVRGFVRRAMAA